jgi:hypothetical protein
VAAMRAPLVHIQEAAPQRGAVQGALPTARTGLMANGAPNADHTLSIPPIAWWVLSTRFRAQTGPYRATLPDLMCRNSLQKGPKHSNLSVKGRLVLILHPLRRLERSFACSRTRAISYVRQ